MALESPNKNEAFLGADDDDFAALDSMAFTGTQSQSQFGMNTVAMNSSGSFGSSSSHSSGAAGGGVGVGDGRENGFSGVSGSLFDRIRARTAEQQKQSLSSQSSQPMMQEPAQSSQQNAFMTQQPSSGEHTMELEKNPGGVDPSNINNAFDTKVSDASTGGTPTNQNNNETTYSFSASAGEDFSQAASSPNTLRVPQYGASRDDPYYVASNNNQQQQHNLTTIQDKASMALAQTGETVKTLFSAGLSGAQAIGAMAQDKIGGTGGGGGRSYNYTNPNVLLREDSLDDGHTDGGMATMSSAPPPPVSAAVASGSAETGGSASDQAYSMLKYGKTFCEDLFGFVMQLPHWGKGVVAVVLLWVLYAFFDNVI